MLKCFEEKPLVLQLKGFDTKGPICCFITLFVDDQFTGSGTSVTIPPLFNSQGNKISV